MKNILLKYKDIMPFVLLGLYALGYIYLVIYYSKFGVDIEYYISLTDILFVTINILIRIITIILILEILLGIIAFIIIRCYYLPKVSYKITKRNTGVIKRFLKIKTAQNYNSFLLLFLGIVILFAMIVFNEILYPFVIGIIVLNIKMSSLKSVNESVDRASIRSFIALITISTLFIFNFMLGYKHANDTLQGVYYFTKPKHIEFTIEGKKISTLEKSNRFIGETSEYFFIHNIILKQTFIYKKDDVENLTIIDPKLVTKDNVKLYFNLEEYWHLFIN